MLYNIDILSKVNCSQIPTLTSTLLSRNKTSSEANVSTAQTSSHLSPNASKPERQDVVRFNVRQLAAIRRGDWKLITGDAGFNRIIPDPEVNITACKCSFMLEI